MEGDGGRGRGYSYFLLALVICSLTAHPFRRGAPFLLFMETPPTSGLSLRFFHTLHSVDGWGFSFIVRLSRLAMDHTLLSRRGVVRVGQGGKMSWDSNLLAVSERCIRIRG